MAATNFDLSCCSCSMLLLGGGRDYESSTEILVFNASTSQVCTGVTTILDGIYELPEVFTVTLTSSDSAVNNISVSESIITIVDFDEGKL